VPDNLNVSITADSTKARVEIELLSGKLTAARKEVRLFREEAAKTGDTTKLTKAVAEVQRLEKETGDLRKETRRTREEVEGLGESLLHLAHGNRPIARLIREFGSLNASVENSAAIFGRVLGGFGGGVAAIAAFKGFEILKDTVVEANKALAELKKAAGEIGVRPVALKAVQEAAQEAGHDVDAATKVMQGFGKAIEENRNKFAAPVVGGVGLPTVLRGGTLETPTPGRVVFPGAQGAGGRMVQVGRGGVPGLTDPTKALEDLDLSKFPKTAEGIEKAARALQTRVLELQKTMNSLDFNIFAKAKFGVSGKELGEIVNDMEEMEKIIKRIQGPLNAASAQLERLAAAQGKLKTIREETTAPFVQAFNEADIAITTALTHFFEAPWKEKFTELWTSISDEAGKIPANIHKNFIDPVMQDWNNFVSGLTGAWTSFCDGIVSAASAAAAAIGSIWQGIKGAAAGAGAAIAAGAQQGAVPGLATGGYVRGPGTGTSDSILARLSAGEFVINSRAVRRLGASFLSGLNGYADGGFVSPQPLRFAAGGLVPSAAGGTPVHLHLDGQSFATSATEGVASALVVAARRQQMRSAGVKPSWYGGRPGA
jgi:hypothetical protein